MVIDHICFAVKDIEESVVYWNNVFGYQRMTSIVITLTRKLKLLFSGKKEASR
jgi:catechol 2,3-dioxygenase-like lactoylglutathione lyase family enzyme